MSGDDERDIDIDSEEDDDMGEDDFNDKSLLSSASSKPMTQAEKRAHHNALERKRRDHIKDSFTSLRDSVPTLNGEKVSKRVSSRAQILKKAAEYIQFMRRKNSAHQHDIEDLKRQNHVLENQIRSLERARLTGSLRSANGDKKGKGDEDDTNEELTNGGKGDKAPASASGSGVATRKLKTMNNSK